MIFYILRRILYAVPILLGVNFITFALFFIINTPDDMARVHLGQKYVTQEAVEQWKQQHGYDIPIFWNNNQLSYKKLSQTLFFQKSLKLMLFQFGTSDAGRDIKNDIYQRMWPSFAIALPTLILGLVLNITFAGWLLLFRFTLFDKIGLFICVISISISSLFYIIVGQYIFAKIFKIFPISGYGEGLVIWKFLLLPILLGAVSGIGNGTRWYRSLLMEESKKDYVRTAKAKGLSEWQILIHHVLPNSLIPIATGVVVIIPSLFLGSLILESFFGIPGLGSYVIDAIQTQDFAIVRSMVFLGTALYILGLILTDICYTWLDPRLRLN